MVYDDGIKMMVLLLLFLLLLSLLLLRFLLLSLLLLLLSLLLLLLLLDDSKIKNFEVEVDGTGAIAILSPNDILQYDKSHDQDLSCMTSISNLNEAAILNTVRSRYKSGKIYTSFEPLLIAINPYFWLPNLYNIDYYESLPEDDKRAHLFYVANNVLRDVGYATS